MKINVKVEGGRASVSHIKGSLETDFPEAEVTVTRGSGDTSIAFAKIRVEGDVSFADVADSVAKAEAAFLADQ